MKRLADYETAHDYASMTAAYILVAVVVAAFLVAALFIGKLYFLTTLAAFSGVALMMWSTDRLYKFLCKRWERKMEKENV